jgi:hypothetical protein
MARGKMKFLGSTMGSGAAAVVPYDPGLLARMAG